MRHALSIVTLGVADVDRAVAFYEKFGWRRSEVSDPAMCTFVITPSTVLGLVPFALLTADAQLGTELEKAPSFGGFTLAVNGHSPADVDEIIEIARAAGATIHQEPGERDWGGYPGYSAYFLDLDGYPWEVAYAPFLDLDAEGRFVLPEGSTA